MNENGDSVSAAEESYAKFVESMGSVEGLTEQLKGVFGASFEGDVESVNMLVNAYETLSRQESLSADQHEFLANSIKYLSELYPGLTSVIQENGVISVDKSTINVGAIQKEIETTQVLEQATEAYAEGKINAEHAMTIAQASETKARIDNMKKEIAAIQALMEAQVLQLETTTGFAETSAIRAERGKIANLQARIDALQPSLDVSIGQIKDIIDFGDNETFSTDQNTDAKDENSKAQDKLNRINEKYSELLDKINDKLQKQNNITKSYSQYSNKYRDSLREEIRILEKKTGIIKDQTSDLKKYNKEVVTTSDIGGTSSISAGTLNSKLGGKLSGYGSSFVKYGNQSGIDPGFLAAVAMHETGNGTSSAVRNKNNAFGIMGSNGLRAFSSLEESIKYTADMLKRLYTSQGLNTVEAIQKKYAPVGVSNDPNGLNNYWVKGVKNFWESFGVTVGKVSTKVANSAANSIADYYFDNYKVTSNFGDKESIRSSPHKGIDFSKPGSSDLGDPIKAFQSGKVTHAFYSSSGGNMVIVKQDDGTVGRYLHMRKTPDVKVGQKVSAGQKLGEIGSTGNSTGAHLHFDVAKNGTYIDPEKYLKDLSASTQATADTMADVSGMAGEVLSIEQQISELQGEIVKSVLAAYEYRRDKVDQNIGRSEFISEVEVKHMNEYRDAQRDIAGFQKDKINLLKQEQGFISDQLKKNKNLTTAQRDEIRARFYEIKTGNICS